MRIAILAVLASLALGATHADAAVDYVRVCSAFGTNFFYSPGTDTCVNAMTGETRKVTEDGTVTGETDVLEEARDASEGVALSLALPNATVDAGKTFGAAVNFGTFNGESAIGLSGAIQAADGLTFNGALGVGLARGTTGGRAGINFSW